MKLQYSDRAFSSIPLALLPFAVNIATPPTGVATTPTSAKH
jgi:hypothetical protein